MIRRIAPLALVLVACSGDSRPGDPSSSGAARAGVEAHPPGSDVWIADLHVQDGIPTGISEPRNVTRRAGYDNQPSFLPDGSGFFYTSIDDLGEADIQRFDLASDRSVPVTSSAPESEYSATPLPGGGGFSAIRVEADSTQRLWSFREDGSEPSVLLADVAPVGYHAWADAETVVLFVLGAPPTLQVGNVRTGGVRTVAQDVGRSLQHIPGGNGISYVQRLEEGTEIRRLDPRDGSSERVAPGVEGGDFHAWTPSGVLLQARGSRLHRWDPETGWQVVADLGHLGLLLSRLAVSPDGSLLAIVAEPEEEQD